MLLKKKYIFGQVVMVLVAGSAFAADLDTSMQVVSEQVQSQEAVSQNMELTEQHRNSYQTRMQEMRSERDAEHMNNDDAKEHHQDSREEMHEDHQDDRDSMREEHMENREGRREHDADDYSGGSSSHDGGSTHH